MPKKTKSAKVLSSKTVFRGKVFSVAIENIQDPDGHKGRRDIVHHGGSVVILPVDDSKAEPRVLLIRQFRQAAGQYLWELPAGGLDGRENPLAGAKRELLEETGYSSQNWKRAMFFYVSPGFLDESMDIYVARGLKPGKAQPEEDEFITKRLFKLSDAIKMVLSGKILDAKTVAGVLWLQVEVHSGRFKSASRVR